jgi:non-reducing end alpha-L-arabinofuranosidase
MPDVKRASYPLVRTIRRRAWFAASVAMVLTAVTLVSAPQAAVASTALPCDQYGAASTPCVAAYSSVRALYGSYDGNLYQVTRASDQQTLDIGVLATGGYANAAAQDSFCAGTTCAISEIFDQSARHNDLTVEGPGAEGGQDVGATADMLPVTVAGHAVYGILMPPGVGYRHTSGAGVATGSQPESMYMVASGTNVNGGCCSDFGNAEVQELDTGNGHMDALNISTRNATGSYGSGPWVAADLENGLYKGATLTDNANHGNSSNFVTAVLKNNGTTSFALKGGNSQSGTLNTWYNGPLPAGGYSPMQLEGSIVLGTGGDDSNRGTGSFFEGAMTAGYAPTATDNAIQANIVSAGYAGYSRGGVSIVGKGALCVDAAGDDTGTNGAQAQLNTCDSAALDQRWVVNPDESLSTVGACLDIMGNSTAVGTKVQLWTCNSAGGQKWVPQTNGSLVNPQSGLCLDDPGGRTTPGTQLQIYTCNGLAAQHFTIG